MGKCLEFNTDVHLLFVDYRQAFGSLKRSAMNIALAKNSVPDKIVKLITMILENAMAKVKIGELMSASFNIDSGVGQSDALSATLFNVVLHDAGQNTRY